jgi:hypothetical protein
MNGSRDRGQDRGYETRAFERDQDYRGRRGGQDRDYNRPYEDFDRGSGYDRDWERAGRGMGRTGGQPGGRRDETYDSYHGMGLHEGDYDRGMSYGRGTGPDAQRGRFLEGELRRRTGGGEDFGGPDFGYGRSFGGGRDVDPGWDRDWDRGRERGRTRDRDFQGDWQEHGPMTGRGPSGYQRSSDKIIEDVCERLTQHGRVDASDIQVTADDGEVTLEGTVSSRREKRMAEDIAENVRGVRDVHNRLQIDEEKSRSANGSGSKRGRGASQRGARSQSTQESSDSAE